MKKNINKIIFTFIFVFIYQLLFSLFNVYAKEPEATSENTKKVIYLTFDDGPSTKITNEILDILKEENVKGTFFVVGYKIEGNKDTLRRIYLDGHSLGLHTYSHKYKEIYSSDENFIKEMDITSEEVKKAIGFSPKAIRFPSGSNGHMNLELLEKLHQKGYKVFDWNLSLSDGLNYRTSTNKLYREATKKCINPNKIFLLLHCDSENKNTCLVLKDIIKYYKNLGYSFEKISDDTDEYYFKPKK